jgi:hypothetical protein
MPPEEVYKSDIRVTGSPFNDAVVDVEVVRECLKQLKYEGKSNSFCIVSTRRALQIVVKV